MQRKLSRDNIERYREANEDIYIEFAERMEKIENTGDDENDKCDDKETGKRCKARQSKATSHLLPLTKNQKIM